MKDLYAEYENECERLTFERLQSFSSIGACTSIAGLDVYMLTIRAWIDLRLCENEIVLGGFSWECLAKYLKRISVHYREGRAVALSNWHRWQIERTVYKASKNFEQAEKIIDDTRKHLNQAFQERPQSIQCGGFARDNNIPPVEGVVSMVDELASRYGCHPMQILMLPISCAFALQKAARIATIPDYKLLEPQSLRDIKSEYLQSIQRGGDYAKS